MKSLYIILHLFALTSLYSAIPNFMINEESHEVPLKDACNKSCCGMHYNFSSETLQNSFSVAVYDVLRYDITLDYSDYFIRMSKDTTSSDSLYVEAMQKITMKIDSAGHKSFEIDAVDLNVIDVTIISNNATQNINYTVKDKSIIFESENEFSVGDTLIINIKYTINRKERIGIYYYPAGSSEIIAGSEHIIYVQSQPSLARYWMPCNDKPYDKALISVSITVPEDYTAISNGTLDSVSSNDGIVPLGTYHFSHDYPTSTYLINAAASRYVYFEQYYSRHTNPQDTVIIGNYVWSLDKVASEGHPFNAEQSLRAQPAMLRLYSSLFGEYTFDRYGSVAVDPYHYGGMEFQTITTIHRNWLKNKHESGLAHEVAHHWIGNILTCASWDDIWINEGGATWCEALWLEQVFNDDAHYYERFKYYASEILKHPDSHLYPVFAVPEEEVFVLNHITYYKAAWVYNMLSEITGRINFNNTMKQIFESNKFKSVSTHDYIELLKSNISSSDMDLDLFFEQWVYDSGYPIYEISAEIHEPVEDIRSIDVYVAQVQSGIGFRSLYESPINIIFTDVDSNVIRSYKVYNNNRNQKFTFNVNFPFKHISIDDTKILCKINQSFTGVSQPDKDIVKIAPNPVNCSSPISFYHDGSQFISEVRIIDLTGTFVSRTIARDSFGINNVIAPQTAGVYLIELICNNSIIREKLVVL